MTFGNPFSGHDSHNDKLTRQLIPALVINNKDPKYLNRVQIRVSEIHKGVADSDLPWSLPVGFSPNGFGSNLGSCFIPPIGASIAVFFPEENDVNTYYIGGIPSLTSVLEAFKAGYPNTYGWVDIGGNVFIVDPMAPSAYCILQNGSYYGIDSENFNVKSPTINFDCSQFNCSGAANFAKKVATNTGSSTSLPAKQAGTAYKQPNVSNLTDY